MGELTFTLAGEEVIALADKALFWPEGKTLFVADVHWGKDATFRQAQRWVPPGTTRDDLVRLLRLLERHRVERLVILGDAFHSEHANEENTVDELQEWRERVPAEILMIMGNHDRKAEGIAHRLNFIVCAENHRLGPWTLRHHPMAKPPKTYVLCGHLHPLAVVRGAARQSLRLPCFWANEAQCILPAFGGFTGGSVIRPKRGDRVILVADGRLLDANRDA